MPWKPGQTGNPYGLTTEQREALAKAKKLTPYAVGRLADLADDDDPKVALAACVAILKAGGIMDADGAARVAEAVEARLQQLIEDAEAAHRGERSEPDNGQKQLEAVK